MLLAVDIGSMSRWNLQMWIWILWVWGGLGVVVWDCLPKVWYCGVGVDLEDVDFDAQNLDTGESWPPRADLGIVFLIANI